MGIQPDSRPGIEGVWLNSVENKHIKIYKKGDHYVGEVIWMDKARDASGKPYLDEKNPIKENRNKPVMGMYLLDHFIEKEGKYYGEMYIPSRGWYLDGEIEILNEDQLKLTGSYGVLHGSRVWNRVK